MKRCLHCGFPISEGVLSKWIHVFTGRRYWKDGASDFDLAEPEADA
jgi:hypothetical protein